LSVFNRHGRECGMHTSSKRLITPATMWIIF
jgi:hypothetical protein